MINVRCSSLEQVRNNPSWFVDSLIDSGKTGATFGMFGCFQSALRKMHVENLTVSESIQSLQNSFLRFNDTLSNKSKQEGLIKNLIAYEKEFNKKNFDFEEGNHRIKWPLHKEVILTGNTPWVVRNNQGFFSFIITELEIHWLTQLRFPLLQSYIARENLKCDERNLSMGVYTLSTNKFEFKCFDKEEIENAIDETKSVFQNIYEDYSKRKK